MNKCIFRVGIIAAVGLFCILCNVCQSLSNKQSTEEIVFHSGPFKVVGDLTLPAGSGQHPVILFVHGDGPNNRTSGVTYPPIMARMLSAGYATFAWDKPGTGESTGHIDRPRLFEQRSQIVVDAIQEIKKRPEIDGGKIGLWGISQAGYVMPIVLTKSEDVKFMIAVSCPGEAGVNQGAFLVSRQAICAGLSEKDAEQVKELLSKVDSAQTYEEYVEIKQQLMTYPALDKLRYLGFSLRVRPEEEWHVHDQTGDYYWDPIEVIEKTTIPVLAFFGERDTQADPFQGERAYETALRRAGNTNFRVELIPGVDHNLIMSETGCIEERNKQSKNEWKNYSPLYLEILEEWLRALNLD